MFSDPHFELNISDKILIHTNEIFRYYRKLRNIEVKIFTVAFKFYAEKLNNLLRNTSTLKSDSEF